MATVLSQNTYGGLWAGEDVISRTLLANMSVERGLLTPHTDIKNKKVFRVGEYKPKLQGYKGEQAPQGTNLTASEFVLELKKYMFRERFDLEILRTTWESTQMAAGSLNDAEGTTAFNDWLFNFIAEQLAIYNDKLYWRGKEGLAADEIIDVVGNAFPDYPGLIPEMIADAAVRKVAANIDSFALTGLTLGATTTIAHAANANDKLVVGDIITVTGVLTGTTQINGLSGAVISKTPTATVVAINSTGFTAYGTGGKVSFINLQNINTVLQQFISLVPRQALKKADFKIHLPGHLETVLLGANAFQERDSMFRILDGETPEQAIYMYGKFRIEFLEYFPENTILGATSNDLHLGLDILDEESVMNIIDLRNTTGDFLLDATCVMKSDVGYASVKAQDFLLYLPQ